MLEINLRKEWHDAVSMRSSVRSYTGAPSEDQLSRLGELRRKLSWQGVTIRLFQGPGLRSAIKGTDVYAVIVAKEGTPQEYEGYMGEALVLEATSMGLGTCWLGAGFIPDIVSRNVNLDSSEAIHCVIAIGQCSLPPFAPKRKPIEKVCGLSEKQLSALGAWQTAAVQDARLAPSAMNLQPWKLTVDSASLTVANNALLVKKYASIDCGICMLHAAVGAASQGRIPKWRKSEDGYVMTA
ncbi:MAG: nitroreductase family protein [Clostridiales bacterium]|nr:nitroreductase family protein [Clostridiales bacterium]